MSVGKRTGMTVFRPGAAGIASFGGGISVTGGMGGGAGNGLLNNLIAYWPGNEFNGNALDLHINALHLTDVNTVTSNPGLVYPLARQYTDANNEYHTRPGDDALLSWGDLDITLASWCYLDAKGASRGIASKWGAAGDRGPGIIYGDVSDQFQFISSWDGNTSQTVAASSLGSPALTTWYLIVVWHDSVADTLNIQVNNGAVDSLAENRGVLDNAYQFRIGRHGTFAWDWQGRIGPTMFWKSAAGGGGCLSAAMRTALWNGGAGLTYASFTT